jgi:hypothetical protein
MPDIYMAATHAGVVVQESQAEPLIGLYGKLAALQLLGLA